ncbi:MAG TPA: MmcQ/YjbR family DNA-binding protein [Ferruginibacter sp.]|jgi:predicted DNA-binding protein (MmcQ/YjbR family)|nr:MmcQ/YjbR family DNA-binding protein [Ferruginibacter sp.]
MDIETLREYILQKPLVTEGFPFGESTLVFKVKEKVFLLAALDASPLQFNVKCDPDYAIELREEYPESVLPGYHMNKKHWNTIIVDGQLSKKMLLQFVDDSYKLVGKFK